jgi:hypothetical protein
MGQTDRQTGKEGAYPLTGECWIMCNANAILYYTSIYPGRDGIQKHKRNG